MAANKHNNNGRFGSRYVLGMDIGTTTVKVAVVDAENRRLVQSLSRETKAFSPSDLGHLGNEQDPHKICTALQFCVSRLPKECLQRVVKIGISGQMHGVLLWKGGEGWTQNHFGRYETTASVSQLFTWQDGRCTPEFLATLPEPDSHLRLSTGQGCATLFWLQRHRPDFLAKFDQVGTIADYVVAMICGLDKPVMSVQSAASWGYYNTVNDQWNLDKLQANEFPVHVLPVVVQAGEVAGKLDSDWYGIAEGTPVAAALGDMQCSVFSTLETERDAVLNISTSAQLSFTMHRGFLPPLFAPLQPTEYFPYFGGLYLAVAASLNGGNVLASFVRMLQQWIHELGLGVPEDKIWEKILTLAEEESSVSDLEVIPTLYGERHLPGQKASVTNIDPLNVSLGKVSHAICKGVIKNITDMLPSEKLVDARVERILGCGSALIRNAILKKEVEAQYNLPVKYITGSDAAVGVALAVMTFNDDSQLT